MINQEATDHYNRAIEMWNSASDQEKEGDRLLRDVASELVLAIKKANEPYPQAHGKLGMFFLMTGDPGKAEEKFNIALRHDRFEINSRMGRVQMALENYREATGLRSLSIYGMFSALRSSSAASNSQSRLKSELDYLIQAYHHYVSQEKDVKKFIELSEMMIDLGDWVQELKLPGGKLNLYAEVLKAPWEKYRNSGYDDEINLITRKAEGRSALTSI